MPIHSGRFSVTRLSVSGSSGKTSLAELGELVDKFKVKKLRLDGLQTEWGIGWISPVSAPQAVGKKLSDWDMSDCRVEDGFLLRMHVEQRKVPGSLLQLLYKQELLEEEARQKKSISRKERLQIKENLKDQLQQKVLPQISYVDGYWDDKAKTLWIFSTGKKPVERFELLFTKTFCEPLNLEISRFDVTHLMHERKGFDARFQQLTPSLFSESIGA